MEITKSDIGKYVRTKEGMIGKIDDVNEYIEVMYGEIDGECFLLDGDKIKKISENIIDLIECGDIVNKQDVAYIKEIDGKKLLKDHEWFLIAKNYGIETIMTKEQYKKHAYQLEEES